MRQHRPVPRLWHGVQDLLCQTPRLHATGEECRAAQVDSSAEAEPPVRGRTGGPIHRFQRQWPAEDATQHPGLLRVEGDQAGERQFQPSRSDMDDPAHVGRNPQESQLRRGVLCESQG
ncbi:unnamed protein product [Prorocentrum cordatum]|uniref:Uncharacterized protein n=1 Tax=Prorocentrum cordatum TaxID=2364126 RepID=A0ABN9PU63_9DINO|nr:unnamed protein product [Polarella glacialis]